MGFIFPTQEERKQKGWPKEKKPELGAVEKIRKIIEGKSECLVFVASQLGKRPKEKIKIKIDEWFAGRLGAQNKPKAGDGKSDN